MLQRSQDAGVMMPTNLAGKYLDEVEFKPFWDALAAEASRCSFIRLTPVRANWNKYSLHQKILWPTDSTLALSRIVYCGVLDRHRTSSSSPLIWAE